MTENLCTIRKNEKGRAVPCFYQVEVIGDIYFITCESCGKMISHPITARFINHVSEENLSRLAVSLIQKGQLTPAESTLADHIMKEI